ncbi:hypothetical protein P3X46_025255 [Hevea brasiliensis]|uniref:Retrotransposon Copia-like N-terminal domain-containing protein n=1 Tax=Hevea brasiliensis TaxID=3981 RepID=A0ABQ9L547_HEVBR|nr:hypothetical protein P3X46_025255 [Hevea brasiliensis]
MATNQDPTQNPSSPYYLHPNENLALVLVSPVLIGPNYHSWSRAMRMALLSKNKLHFVDGYLRAPATTDPLYHAWERCNTMGDILRISDLQKEIYSLKQGHRTVTKYFIELKILWDELMNFRFRPIPNCSCANPYNYGALLKVTEYLDYDYVLRFLKGLNDQYANVRSQIMMLDSFPTINKAFSLVVQQERQISSSGNQIEPKVLVNKAVRGDQQEFKPRSFYSGPKSFTNNGPRPTAPSVDTRFYTFCGKPRHTVETCYKKHGYPPDSKRYSVAANYVSIDDDPTAVVQHSEGAPISQSQGSLGNIPGFGFT